MRLLIDEMWSREVAAGLAALGHDVIAVDNHPDLRSRSDDELFAFAVAEGRTIVTENVADFRRLASLQLQSGRGHAGLILTTKVRYDRGHAPIDRLVSSIDALASSVKSLDNREHWLE